MFEKDNNAMEHKDSVMNESILLTIKPYRYNQCVSSRLIGGSTTEDMSEDFILFPNDESNYYKAVWYEILERKNGAFERVGYITGYHIYGEEIHNGRKLGDEMNIFFDFDDVSELLSRFYSSMKEELKEDVYLMTSMSLKKEYAERTDIINAVIEMLVESNFFIYNFITNQVIATVGETEVFDTTVSSGSLFNEENFKWLTDELFHFETKFRLYIKGHTYYIRDVFDIIERLYE